MRGSGPIGCLLAVATLAHAQTVGPPPPPPSIATLAAQASVARDNGQLPEAVRLYKLALARAPRWQQGWWELGTIYYEQDQYTGCQSAFRRFTSLSPKMGPGFAFLGLCEFQLKQFAPSLEHLEESYALGLPQGEDLTKVSIYHLALLQTKAGNFERAIQFCRLLIRLKPDDPQTMAVAGIAGLRQPLFPHELSEADRDVALKLGAAMMPSSGDHAPEEAFRRFESLLKEYPSTPHLRYAYSMMLLPVDPDRGLEQLKKELSIDGDNVPALVSLAFEYLRRGESAQALPYAERAVKLAPNNFPARTCLGRVLLDRDQPDVAGAIRELESAVKLAPDSPQVRSALAEAYSRAGRRQDAARERAMQQRLSAQRKEIQ